MGVRDSRGRSLSMPVACSCPGNLREVVRVSFSGALEWSGTGGCVPGLRSGVPKGGRMGSAEEAENRLFWHRTDWHGTCDAKATGWVSARRGGVET